MKSEDFIEIEHEIHRLMCLLLDRLGKLEKKMPRKLGNKIKTTSKEERHGNH